MTADGADVRDTAEIPPAGGSTGRLIVTICTIVATLPVSLRSEGTGIYSLVRNLGSPIGISVTGALLQIYTQANHGMLAGEATLFSRALHSGAASRIRDLSTAPGC